MIQEIADLTDKEKEALRLLVEGHDAKSSAVSLGISVHTVNDRLRNARRKLHVSSSREAARILRDAEGEEPQDTPQNLTHASFGIADDGARADTEVLNQHSQKEPMRFTWLAGGMLIMSILIAVAVIAAVSTSGEVASSAGTSGQAAPEAASTASTNAKDAESFSIAQAFLAEVDAGDWAGSWTAAGGFIQSQVDVESWTATVQPVREPLGKVKSRSLAKVDKTRSLPGAPEGEYEVLQFSTEFEGSGLVKTETVIMIRTDDRFDVAGFFIR